MGQRMGNRLATRNQHVIDAHALVWHLTGDSRLGIKARTTLQQIESGKAAGLVAVIVLAEILYASERSRIRISFEAVLKELKRRKNYRIVSFTRAVLLAAEKIHTVSELHDRIIVATAVHESASVITRDTDIADAAVTPTVW